MSVLSGAQEYLSDRGMHPYDYELPRERIADRPCYPFHDARMMSVRRDAVRSDAVRSDAVRSDAVKREQGQISHSEFSYLPLLLGSEDVLVINNTQVMKARLYGNLESSGAAIELLLLEELGDGRWKAMGRPLRKLQLGAWIQFTNGPRCKVTVGPQMGGPRDYFVEVQFLGHTTEEILGSGTMPIPPYIRNGRGDKQDEQDYQTPFARHQGSVAAPTAGLHFTEELLQVLRRRGVEIVELTLHVGPASFLSAWEYDPRGDAAFHPPGVERGRVDPEMLMHLRQLKMAGKRLVAVGTTVVRLLETVFSQSAIGEVNASSGQIGSGCIGPKGEIETDLFIQPGYRFRAVDAMITNFHQPRSTHLLLVEAFMGRNLLERAYQNALAGEYKFLSYGDGMFIE